MYAHCLFCNADLGRNEALDAFPVGRRLAYDAAKGRLWVVCTRCARWNLTPLEERWEAIEQAERLYRGTRLRASTENVGLARVADNIDLLRIGAPLRPELAAWRYSSVFARRRRRATAMYTLAITGGVAVVGAGAWFAISSGFAFPLVVGGLSGFFDRGSANDDASPLDRTGDFVVRVPIGNVLVSMSHAAVADARVGTTATDGFHVTMPYGGGRRVFRGQDAWRTAASLLAYTNSSGARRETVAGAVDMLTTAGGADAYLARVGRQRVRTRRGYLQAGTRGDEIEGVVGVATMPDLGRLALEMAVHEEAERRAMDGELAELERAWRDAEEIAAIADNLVLPPAVETAWERLRRSVSG